jgi:phosphoglycolate phosphatase
MEITVKKIDTVIFDLDGTLLNTLEDLTDSVNFSLKNASFPTRTLEEVRHFLGNGAERLMELSIPEGKNNPLFAMCLVDFRKHYKKNIINKTCPYPGIMTVLKKLKNNDYKLAVVSNKFDEAVKMLNKHFFSEYIKTAIGERAGILKKPAPDTVYTALKELGTSSENTVYVGDSEVDAKTAKNSGLIFVGVTWGFRDREVLKNEKADYIIDKPEELLNIL